MYSNFISKQLKGKKINNYLHVKKSRLFYKEVDLFDLTKKYGSPLEVAYVDMITERVKGLKANFNKAIKKYAYGGKFFYAYATKANYYSEVVSTALNSVNFIETTSSYDLDIIENLHKNGIFKKETLILCNGFKVGRYFEKILYFKEKGFNILPILENIEEVAAFSKSNLDFDIGLRLKINEAFVKKFESNNRLSSKIDSRFGFGWGDLLKTVKKIEKFKNLKLKLLHLHIGGTISSIKPYAKFVSFITEKYCDLKKISSELEYLDLGGGLPVQYSLNFDFDYQKFTDELIKAVSSVVKKRNCVAPNIIGEYGRYTVNDHGFFIFKIVVKKEIEKNKFWYLVDGSLMNLLPDSWALGQSFLVLPLNLWENKVCKIKLGGITCDPDDTYYKAEKENYLYLPEIKEGQELYIGIFGTGAYQEMISGVGGVHHCLLPEGNEVIIYKDKGKLKFDKISKLQTPEQVLKILSYHNRHNLKRYK